MNSNIFDTSKQNLIERSAIPFGIFKYEDNRIITHLLTAGFFELFGYSDIDETYAILNKDIIHNIHPDDAARIGDASIRFVRDDEEYDVTYRWMVRGKYKIIHAKGAKIYDENGGNLFEIWFMDEGEYVYNDEHKPRLNENPLSENIIGTLNEDIKKGKGSFDYLTGIPNRISFFENALVFRDKSLAEGRSCVIGYTSINGMKYFNKKYGLDEGDNLLRNFGAVLVNNFGLECSCRVGQDNFAFFSVEDELEEKLERVIQEFDERSKGRASFRVGIYSSNMGSVGTSFACDRARYACDTLKNQNKSGYVYYSSDMLEYENRRQYVIDNLDKAISENWIQAYYQPIVRAANGRVSDEEALARWIDPERGMLSPADFIPILEDTKLIYKVDLHMVDEIIKKVKDQAEHGLYVVPTSVNLSRTDFDVCDIVKEITDKIDAAGLDRSLLTIEITESVVGSDFDFIKEQVERFQKLGFSVWMDDFGSGYSSLDVLQSIHFDVIKLDMRFMKEFDNGDKSRVIVTELMKMALGLGIETVCEGVERADQVQFLKEIGCTKLQGYHFCKPVSYEQILERYRTGKSIGFENPDESEYYESIGRINLYDMAAVANEDSDMDDEDSFSKYFNALPMAVLEADSKTMRVVRCNRSYKTFVNDAYQGIDLDNVIELSIFDGKSGANLVKALEICARGVSKVFIDEKNGDEVIHSIIRCIASNPVTGVTACAIVVLGVTKEINQGITYADVANSLSADYMHLYYVDIESDEFDEYTPDASGEDLLVERHGEDFFNASRKDALEYIFKDDLDRFTKSFTKENILKTIELDGTYTITYRLLVEGKPTYVSMKAIKMSKDESHLIIGVNNVDTQMKQQEALERMKEEQMAFARITALAGNYICIYTVNPENDSYSEYQSSSDYAEIGLARYGDRFFERSKIDSTKAIYSEDLEYFQKAFTKENVLQRIEENGYYIINYRLMIDGEPQNVSLKAVMFYEKDGPQLIIGVSKADA